MNTLVIDKKKYVVIPQDDYKRLVKQAASHSASARKLSLADGKKMACLLIDKWHKEK